MNVWACITAKGVGSIVTFKQNITSDYYFEECLKDELHTSVERTIGVDGTWYFVDDNAPTHRTHDVQEWLENPNPPRQRRNLRPPVLRLPHPAKSPDLNPIENIFAVLKRNIEQRRPSTSDELEEAIHEEWANFPDELCKKTIRSMSARLQAVRDANSHATGY